ncbi:MAG: YkgJ family cysteine cluster protein [Bdellovibrio sp.]|nr:YkgJ family cysteine cluster protein [Bdellovibrio sp.]
MSKHPCLSCGACCAFFRVSLHWLETSAESYGVPLALTERVSPHQNSMLGTGHANPSCISLKGIVGESVSCTIYENRPGSCRSFSASYEDGTVNSRCAVARLSKGLGPLQPSDWPAANGT